MFVTFSAIIWRLSLQVFWQSAKMGHSNQHSPVSILFPFSASHCTKKNLCRGPISVSHSWSGEFRKLIAVLCQPGTSSFCLAKQTKDPLGFPFLPTVPRWLTLLRREPNYAFITHNAQPFLSLFCGAISGLFSRCARFPWVQEEVDISVAVDR